MNLSVARVCKHIPVIYSKSNLFHRISVTGIQPSGKVHLDLHSLTVRRQESLSENILHLVSVLIACGFGTNDKMSLFLQSSIRGLTELSWIFSTVCSVYRLFHLPQWREKSELHAEIMNTSQPQLPVNQNFENVSVGLLSYPLLQAADVTLFNAHIIPVGIDQLVHIELARDLIRAAIFRWPALEPIMRIPESITFEVAKIASLRNPLKKMSKSDSSDNDIIYVTDEADAIRTKIRRAQTDSSRSITYDCENRPGVANLLRILAALKDCHVEELLPSVTEWSKEDLKSHLIDSLLEEFDPIRRITLELQSSEEGLMKIKSCLKLGSESANAIAGQRLKQIYSAIGLQLTEF